MKILTCFAHPDDETLAAGGFLSSITNHDHEVFVAIPATGALSRSNATDEDVQKLRAQCREALKIFNIPWNNIFFGNFADNEMDTYSRLKIIKWFERIITDMHPDVILTHHYRCTNIDHQLCHEAVVVATRPNVNRHISIVCGEIPSSTGYLRPTNFEPNIYVQLTELDLAAKINALQCYENEIGEHPHPRSIETINALATLRGAESGYHYAEAFTLHRGFTIV